MFSTAWLTTLLLEAHQGLMTHPDAEPARAYLLSRGVAPDLWTTYRLGFGLGTILPTQFTAEFRTWFLRYWGGSVLFPLYGPLGTMTGVIARPLPVPGEVRRYQRFQAVSSEIVPPLFGLSQALPHIWATGQVVLVEGVFDYFAVQPWAPNSVAILTAHVPTAVQRFLGRYARRVTALLDMDEPGRTGVLRLNRSPAFQLVAPAYGAKDPGELAMAGGVGILLPFLKAAQVPVV